MFQRLVRASLALTLVGVAAFAGAQKANVKISAAYGGGGGATANTYLKDYVELLNTGTSSADLTNTSIQYGSATGNYGSSASNIYAFPASTTIPAKSYLLIATGSVGTASPSLTMPTPDISTTNMNMSGTSGKVAFVDQAAALNTKPSLPNALIIDAVSWGAADNAEGGAATNGGAALVATQVNLRNNLGQTDTDNNNADFTVATASAGNAPRNSSSTPVPVTVSSFMVD
ncbi:MAG: lamin tail domain-containing protein [Candidatus Sumerlaeaceae bacterium]|nr:lamin tail domain-containing protein [Candidatus Sumerlaeaceae bacterium]